MVATKKNKCLENLEQLNNFLEKVDTLSSSGKKRSIDSGMSKPSAGGSSANTTVASNAGSKLASHKSTKKPPKNTVETVAQIESGPSSQSDKS